MAFLQEPGEHVRSDWDVMIQQGLAWLPLPESTPL